MLSRESGLVFTLDGYDETWTEMVGRVAALHDVGVGTAAGGVGGARAADADGDRDQFGGGRPRGCHARGSSSDPLA